MSSLKQRLSLALAVLLVAGAAAVRAQPQQPSPKADAAAQDDSVTEKGFRSKIIEIKHRDPIALYNVIRPLGSGFKGSTITPHREMKLITIRDFPENIALIEEALKRLDTPEPARPDIEFRVHILIANNSSSGRAGGEEYPADLREVIRQLQTTLNYKYYTVMSSQVLRAKEGPGGLGNKGVASLRLSNDTAGSQNPIFYDYRIERLSLEPSAAGAWKVQIGNFNFAIKVPIVVGSGSLQYENVGFNTPVSVREGEKVVVGTTSMQDSGIVIVIAANVVK